MIETNDRKLRRLKLDAMVLLRLTNNSCHTRLSCWLGKSGQVRWMRFIGALIFIVIPTLAYAHDSTKAVEVEIGDRERFQELTDQVAPVFTLQDVKGNAVSLADFHGKVVILNFLYSRCEEACPLHSVKLAKVQEQISLASQSDSIQFVTVATDTEDAASTAESMRTHGPRYGLNPANWVFLHGPAGSEGLGMRFAAAYGLKFVATDDGKQMHGVVTFLIDAKGQMRARYHGLDFNPTNLTLHAAALVHDIHNSVKTKSNISANSYTGERSVVGLVAFASIFIVIFMMIFYFWRRHHRGSSLPVKTPISPVQEKLE
jgi:protein SCO1/2